MSSDKITEKNCSRTKDVSKKIFPHTISSETAEENNILRRSQHLIIQFSDITGLPIAMAN